MNRPITNVTIFSVLWALQIYVTKVAFFHQAQLGAFVFLSALSTLLVCSIYFLPKYAAELRPLWQNRRPALWLILLAGFVHYGLGGMFSTAGVAFTSATSAAFLSKLSFVFTVGMATLFLAEPLTRQKLGAAAIMLLGAYLLATQGQVIAPGIGNLLVIIACICWSSGTILVKLALKRAPISGELISAVRPFVGTPFLLAYSLLVPQFSAATRAAFGDSIWQPQILPYALLNGLLTVLTWVFLNRTLTVASASYMTMMSMLTPVIVAVLAFSFLGEKLAPIQFAGASLIVTGAMVTHLSERHRRSKAIPA
jgi:O-acetylserine/cysteine efflux transporter